MKTYLVFKNSTPTTARVVPATTKVFGGARLLTLADVPTQAQIDAAFAPPVVDPLIAAQTKARDAAKLARTALLAAGFSYGGKVIQTRNDTDIASINSAALKATNDATFSTVWIAADNSYLPLDHAGVIAMQAAMVDRGNVIFAAYVTLSAQIAACTTEAEVNALPALTV